MKDTVETALQLWGMDDGDWMLVAARENHVYRVETPRGIYALRLHRPGYRSNVELWSELEWLRAMALHGLHVPEPVRASDGAFLHMVQGVQIDVLSWLDGKPMGRTGDALETGDRQGLFRAIGREMARLHQLSNDWTPPETFTRCVWNRAGLVGETPLWGRFWENPFLTDKQRNLFLEARDVADTRLAKMEAVLDYGLIHADLVRENVLIDGDRIQLIDFDDGGFGFRLFDLATTLLKNVSEPDYADLKMALIDGYSAVRSIDTGALDLFMMLRALTYVGWIVPRIEEDGAAARNARFATLAERLAEEYLASCLQ